MGLLDQLTKQAELRKQDGTGSEQQVADREQAYKQLDAALQSFKEYLGKLLKLLSDTGEKVQQRYEMPGYGTIVAQISHDYELRLHNPNKACTELRLSFSAAILSAQCPSVEIQGVSRVQTINAAFQKHRIPAMVDSKKDASGIINYAKFCARGKIPLTMVASTDASTGVVKVTLENFEDLSCTSKTYGPEQFNESLFDLLGRYVARKDSDLTKEKLPDGVLKKLRHTAQQNEMRRKWEEKLSAQAETEEAARRQAANENRLGNRLLSQGKNLVGKLGLLVERFKKPKG